MHASPEEFRPLDAQGYANRRETMVCPLGLVDYADTWRAMQAYTAQRNAASPDQLWLLEHPPVYTYGVAGRESHLPRVSTSIPLLKVDRGGQVTYHGPGQLIVYVLWDLARAGLNVRQLVRKLEAAVIELLAKYGVKGALREGAPGVYVDGAKIAALGLKIRKGCSYHGLSFNVDMDLHPFSNIDPCGYPAMPVTQLRDLGVHADKVAVGQVLLSQVKAQLGVTT